MRPAAYPLPDPVGTRRGPACSLVRGQNGVDDSPRCIANDAWALDQRKARPRRSDARSALAGTARQRLKAVSKKPISLATEAAAFAPR